MRTESVIACSGRGFATYVGLFAVAITVRSLCAQSDLAFRSASHVPPAMDGVTLGFDEARGEGLFFGGIGIDSNSAFRETWSWSGTKWRRRYPQTMPPARSQSAMCWDPKTKCVLMFGGTTGTALINDTWLWDGKDWRQAAAGQVIAGTCPSPRKYARMAHDPVRGQLVLFGGLASTGTCADTWVWDGVQWTLRTPATRQPTSRYWHAMAWNPVTSRVAVFGGISWNAGRQNFLAVEEWDGQDWVQCNATVVGTPAPSYMDAGAVTDPQGRGVLLYGTRFANAVGQSPTPLDCLWDGTGMHVQAPSPPPPSGRTLVDCLMLDTHRSKVLLYGGVTDLSVPDSRDTWQREIPNGTWKSAMSYGGLGAWSYGVGAAHVPWRDAFIVQGSDTNRSIWWFDDRGVEYCGPGPTFATQGAVPLNRFLVDPVRRRIFGYYYQLGYLYELQGNAWSLIPASSHGIAPQAVFGGCNQSDGSFPLLNGNMLCRWSNGTTIPVVPVPTPGSAGERRVVADSTRGVVSVISRISGGVRVDEWDGQSWASTTSAIGNLSYNLWDVEFMPGVGTVLLASSLSTSPSRVWCWDGASWTPRQTSGDMAANFLGSMTYDRARARMRFSVRGATVLCDDFWDLQAAELQVDNPDPSPGTLLHFTVQSPPHAGQLWLLALSRSTYPGVVLTGLTDDPYRLLPLAADDLLFSSIGVGLRGLLDVQGRGSASLAIPADPSVMGFEFHAAAVSIASGPRLGLISSPVGVYVTR